MNARVVVGFTLIVEVGSRFLEFGVHFYYIVCKVLLIVLFV